MPQSILDNIKKVIGIAESDTSFDVDLLMHINTVFARLGQLGVGPAGGFWIEDSAVTWDAFLPEATAQVHQIKTYMYLQVKLYFDPPSTSYALESMDRQIQKLEWLINVDREGVSWIDPTLPALG